MEFFLPRPEPDCDGLIFTHFSSERREVRLSAQLMPRAPQLAREQLVYNLLVACRLAARYSAPCAVATSMSANDYVESQSRRRGSEYVPYAEMRASVSAFRERGLLEVIPGRPGRRTRLVPSARFAEAVDRAGADGVEVTEPPRGRLLLRKWICESHTKNAWQKRYVDFNESAPEQARMIAALEYINGNNRTHRFSYLPTNTRSWVDIEPSAVEFNRIFNEGRWDRGGRFTCLMHSLRREERATLRIDGRASVELDYSGLHPTMLYHLAGMPLDRKAYDVPGIGLENRRAAKLALLIAFNASSEDSAVLALRRELAGTGTELHGTTPAGLLRRLRAAHAPIKQYFFSGVGPELQFYDSTIAEYVMLRFAELGIPCVGVHDSFVTPAIHAEKLRAEMGRAYREVMGVQWCPQIDRK